jgi:hypothetical protein
MIQTPYQIFLKFAFLYFQDLYFALVFYNLQKFAIESECLKILLKF